LELKGVLEVCMKTIFTKGIDKHINLSLETARRLEFYLERTYGSYHKPFSAVVEKAITEFLDRAENGQ